MEVPSNLLNQYLQRRKRDLVACLDYLQQEDFQALEKVGHQLKGSAATFGHPELAMLGKQLEQAAIQQNAQSLQIILAEFSHWIKSHS
jgi:HPt (histidine-containing phosphotransfer) domain-containing protein